jgi:hypothetical protein
MTKQITLNASKSPHSFQVPAADITDRTRIYTVKVNTVYNNIMSDANEITVQAAAATPPSAPLAVRGILQVASSSVEVHWTPPTDVPADHVSNDYQYYMTLHYGAEGTEVVEEWTGLASDSPYSFSVPPLGIAGRTYTVQIQTKYQEILSEPSGTIQVILPRAAPPTDVELVTEEQSRRILVSWSPPTTATSAYVYEVELFQRRDQGTSTMAAHHGGDSVEAFDYRDKQVSVYFSATFADLVRGRMYRVRVRAYLSAVDGAPLPIIPSSASAWVYKDVWVELPMVARRGDSEFLLGFIAILTVFLVLGCLFRILSRRYLRK